MKVTKRNGEIVDFDLNKIIIAIQKAFENVQEQDNDDIAIKIARLIESSKTDLSVEEIQDQVENYLMATEHKNVARAYINYRYLHNLARKNYQDLIKSTFQKITAEDVQNQNANVDEHSFGGRMGESQSNLMRHIALNYILSPMAKNNHLNNEIYIHDLDHYAVGDHNCLTLPFDDLLANGFNTRQTDVRPAQSVSTAFQLVAVLFQLQSLNQFGGVAASHIDWTMVPYVRKSFYKHWKDGMKYCENRQNIPQYGNITEISIEDKRYKKYSKAYDYAVDMTKREIYQSVEAMYHNLK